MSENTEKFEYLESLDSFDGYQRLARLTSIYPPDHRVTYPLLGLVGELGEFANKYKKVIRDGRPFPVEDAKNELGDMLWYFAILCDDYGLNMSSIAAANIEKLTDRKDRGVLGGSGDNR